MGPAEYRNYCAAVDRAARVLKTKAVVEHLIDNIEKLLRSYTSPTNHMTLAAALSVVTPTLEQSIDQFAVAKTWLVPSAPAAEGGRGGN